MDQAYPIASPVNVIVRRLQIDPVVASNLRAFLEFIATFGQDEAERLNFSSLPNNVLRQFLANIASIVTV